MTWSSTALSHLLVGITTYIHVTISLNQKFTALNILISDKEQIERLQEDAFPIKTFPETYAITESSYITVCETPENSYD